mmetsp:Transcript_43868/g.42400  ORF Transcript_43868/g.42400 Transcript_43868/m.42400 type:complete len:97 (+) Transcript_43868:220-510(+)
MAPPQVYNGENLITKGYELSRQGNTNNINQSSSMGQQKAAPSNAFQQTGVVGNSLKQATFPHSQMSNIPNTSQNTIPKKDSNSLQKINSSKLFGED